MSLTQTQSKWKRKRNTDGYGYSQCCNTKRLTQQPTYKYVGAIGYLIVILLIHLTLPFNPPLVAASQPIHRVMPPRPSMQRKCSHDVDAIPMPLSLSSMKAIQSTLTPLGMYHAIEPVAQYHVLFPLMPSPLPLLSTPSILPNGLQIQITPLLCPTNTPPLAFIPIPKPSTPRSRGIKAAPSKAIGAIRGRAQPFNLISFDGRFFGVGRIRDGLERGDGGTTRAGRCRCRGHGGRCQRSGAGVG